VARQVLPAASKWAGLRYGLRAVSSRDPVRSAIGWELVRRTVGGWNRSFTTPPGGAVEDVLSMLDRLPGTPEVARIRFLVGAPP